MDSFFGIGAPELVVILLLAGIVMGPKRIQQVAFWLGKVTAQLQGVSRLFVRQLNAELASVDEDGELTDAYKEVQDLRRQLNELKSEITSVATRPMVEGQRAVNQAKKMAENSIQPPKHKSSPSAPIAKPEPADNGQPADLPGLIEIPDDPES